jgi:RNA-directed DNA polymerase
MSVRAWFKSRGYGHFDVPVGLKWAESINPYLVARHAWSPLIHYVKETKRYKVAERKTVPKKRDIMFASHRDAAILAKYSADLVCRLDAWYNDVGLNNVAIAYRSLGKSNYHFAKVVQDYVRSHDPVMILCFDVTGFFDNIEHGRLKIRLKWLLDVAELPDDWYKVFRFITKYRCIARDDLKKDELIASRMARGSARRPIATIEEIKAAAIPIQHNANKHGIPQGTPISASMSNLYMAEFDLKLKTAAEECGALFQRYSDDILVACSPGQADALEALVLASLAEEALEVQPKKTERCLLTGKDRLTFQYLGYHMGYVGAQIRPGSLSKQWRSAKRAIRNAERKGLTHLAEGKGEKIFTRKLRAKLTHVGARNFLSYARRSADELDSLIMRAQVKRLHRYTLKGIARIEKHKPKP